jgi:hypothetical protein
MRDGYRGVCRSCRNADKRVSSPLAEQLALGKRGLKRCNECSEVLPVERFQAYRKLVRGRETLGHSVKCVDCRNASRRSDFDAKDDAAARKRERWNSDSVYRARQRSSSLKWRYGIDQSEADALLADQGGVCAVCGGDDPRARNWHVDHDHATGAVRGILCGPCNVSLGGFQDDPDRLISAAMYLLANVNVLEAPRA